jgi:hypothetical protein
VKQWEEERIETTLLKNKNLIRDAEGNEENRCQFLTPTKR